MFESWGWGEKLLLVFEGFRGLDRFLIVTLLDDFLDLFFVFLKAFVHCSFSFFVFGHLIVDLFLKLQFFLIVIQNWLHFGFVMIFECVKYVI